MENQPPSISPRKSFPKWLVVIVIVFLLATSALFSYQNFKLKQQLAQIEPTNISTNERLDCLEDSDCVIGINPIGCCFCPEAINKDFVGKNNWEEYDQSTDYSKRSQCRTFMACKPCQTPTKPVCQNNQCVFQQPSTNNDVPVTKAECFRQGGLWQRWGLLGQEYCQIPASDAGKSCTDGSQCSLKNCLASNGTSPGECQRFQAIFGCNKFIHNGVIDIYALCSD